MAATGTGGITTGAQARAPKHTEINEAINYLQGKIDALGFLACKIRGEKSQEEKADKSQHSESLETILNGAPGRIRVLADRLRDVTGELEEMLF